IDQAEEVFTLAQTPQNADDRRQALEMLRLASEAGDFKVILSLRTEYYGRFVDGLRQGARAAKGGREDLVTDFDEARLTEAIRKPADLPKYDFCYADGVAAKLAGTVVEYCRNRQYGVLPLAQVICTQLYERLPNWPDRVIRMDNVAAIGGL